MTARLRWIGLVLWLCLQCAGYAQSLSIVSLGQGEQETMLRQNIRMVAEKVAPGGAAWGPQEAADAIAQGQGIEIRMKGVPYRSDLPHWGVVRLRHDARETDWVVYYRLATLENVQAFARQEGGTWEPLQALHLQRSFLSGYHYPSFALSMRGQASYEIALRVQTRAPIRMPVLVAPAYRFYDQHRGDLVQAGIALAVPLVVLLYLAALLPSRLDLGLRWFIALIALESIGAMWVSGHGHVLLPFLSREHWPIIGRLAYMAMAVVGWLHVERFVGKHRLPAVLRAAAWLTVVLLAVSGLLEILRLVNTRDVFTYALMLYTLIATFACLLGRLKGVPYAGIYAAVWGAFILAALISVLGLVGIAAVTGWNVYYAQSSVAAILFGLVAVGHVRERERVIQAERLKAQQLNDTLAIRQRFFAATNHDLQQPVHSLGIYLDLARTRLGQLAQPDSRLTEFLSDAKASYTGVAQFLDVLLDMARLDAGLLKPKPRNLPLEPLLERLGREYQLIAGRAGLELRRLPTDAVVFSDPHLLERIIRNLLANAVRYTQSGGVLIAVRSRQGQWRLDVFDTGPGLTPQDQEQLFSPFHSLSKSPREEQSGMGLGLYIVKALSQRLGHTVELKSQMGRGSRFSIGMQAAD